LTDHRRAHRKRQSFAGIAGRIGEHQFPWQIGRVVVDHQHDPFELSRRVLEIMRHHELEEHAAKIFLPDLAGDLLADQHFDQARLALLEDRFGAGTLTDIKKTQTFGDCRARSPSGRRGVIDWQAIADRFALRGARRR
jgi:hypothetical protein